MLSVLLIALTAQLKITAADVPVIMGAVVEHMESDTAFKGENPLSGRPLTINASSAEAFREVLSGSTPRMAGSRGEYAVRPEAEVVTCQDEGRRCQIPDGSSLLTIEQLAAAPSAGEYLLRVRSKWNDGSAESGLASDTRVLTIAKSNGVWRVVDDAFAVY